MKYISIKIYTAPNAISIISGFLSTYDIYEYIIDDSKVDETSLTIFLEDNEENANLTKEIKIAAMKLKSDELYGKYSDLGRMYVESSIVDDASWKDKWKEAFKTFKVSDKFTIKPSWDSEKIEGDYIINIDPGMAFGTGAHETTRSCINILEDIPLKGKSVLDIGTGSGILSIVAKILGAESVKAIDIDPDSIQVAQENFERNNIEGVDLDLCDICQGLNFEADIIVANLISSLIITILPSLQDNLKAGGIIILSGILLEERERVNKVLADKGYKIISSIIDGEWYTLKVEKNNA